MKADATKVENYRLVELRATNFKRLRAVRIKADGRVIKITGKNGQGKSSVLDAFSAAVGGKKLCPAEPIRKGETEAQVYVDLGALRVTRRFWKPTGESGDPYHSDVLVEFNNGQRPKKPQDFLATLGATEIAIDPIEFIRLKPKEQFDALRTLVPGFDFDKNAKLRLQKEQERVLVGRDRDRAKGAAEAIEVDHTVGDKPLDVTALVNQMAGASTHNSTIETRKRRRQETSDTAIEKRDEADALRAEAKQMEARAQLLDAEAVALDELLAKAEPLPDPIDTTALQAQINDANRVNALVRLVQDRNKHREEYTVAAQKWNALQAEIVKLDEQKVEAIAAAKLPVAGLGFGDDAIMLGGVPFDQASMAEKLRASVAIAMASKNKGKDQPQIRVLAIHDGSLLDEDSLKLLEELAEDQDFIILLERVGTEGGGIVIDDGSDGSVAP